MDTTVKNTKLSHLELLKTLKKVKIVKTTKIGKHSSDNWGQYIGVGGVRHREA